MIRVSSFIAGMDRIPTGWCQARFEGSVLRFRISGGVGVARMRCRSKPKLNTFGSSFDLLTLEACACPRTRSGSAVYWAAVESQRFLKESEQAKRLGRPTNCFLCWRLRSEERRVGKECRSRVSE